MGGAVPRFFRRKRFIRKYIPKRGNYEPEPVNVEFLIWRPILAGLTTLQEIETHWSFADLLDAHEVLDIKEDVEEFHQREVEKRMKKK